MYFELNFSSFCDFGQFFVVFFCFFRVCVIRLQEMVIGISKVKGIERVAFDLTPKPPGTTEWE